MYIMFKEIKNSLLQMICGTVKTDEIPRERVFE